MRFGIAAVLFASIPAFAAPVGQGNPSLSIDHRETSGPTRSR